MSTHQLLSLGSCVHLTVWVWTLGRRLDCNGLVVSVLAAGLRLFFPGEESVRVPLHVGGVQQLFRGIDHGDPASPRADPAAPLAVLARGPRRLSDGDVREGQLEGILARRAPDGWGRRQPVVLIGTPAVFIIGPLSGCLKLTQLRFLVSTWEETKKHNNDTVPHKKNKQNTAGVCERTDYANNR